MQQKHNCGHSLNARFNASIKRIVFIMLVCLSTWSYALAAGTESSSNQAGNSGSNNVTVTVVDDAGAVIGASVMVKGTTNGNSTDIEGQATLKNVPANSTVVVSYVGYLTQEVKLAGRRAVTVKLIQDAQALSLIHI